MLRQFRLAGNGAHGYAESPFRGGYGQTIGDVFSIIYDPNVFTPYGDEYHLKPRLVNLELVRAGLAWHYIKYAPDDKALAAAEAEARKARLGLWSDRRHVAPWDWRKLSKAERDKLR